MQDRRRINVRHDDGRGWIVFIPSNDFIPLNSLSDCSFFFFSSTELFSYFIVSVSFLCYQKLERTRFVCKKNSIAIPSFVNDIHLRRFCLKSRRILISTCRDTVDGNHRVVKSSINILLTNTPWFVNITDITLFEIFLFYNGVIELIVLFLIYWSISSN